MLDTAPPGLIAAGSAAGLFPLGQVLTDGGQKAQAIAEALGRTAPAPAWRTSEDAADLAPLWQVGMHRGKAFVDFQNDVTDSDVALAAREGFVSVEHLKRYTTLGMATDQGKIGQLNGQALLAAATGRTLAETGTIRPRPPHLPVSIGAMAGHHRGAHFRPERHTASHQWAQEMGAVFTDAGLWKRAQYFPRPGESGWLESVNREVTATRNGVGICDDPVLTGNSGETLEDFGVIHIELYPFR